MIFLCFYNFLKLQKCFCFAFRWNWTWRGVGKGRGSARAELWAARTGDGIASVSSWKPCTVGSGFVCLFFSQLTLPWRISGKNISLISSLLLSLKISYVLFNSLMVAVLCPYFIRDGGSSLASDSLPSCAVPQGKEFPAQSSGCRKEHPNPPWLFGMLCHGFGCPNVLLCFSAHDLLVFSYLQMVTARDFGAIPPIPVFWILTWILAGCKENSAPRAGDPKGLGAPRASLWWELPQSPTGENWNSWGIERLFQKRKKPGFELTVLIIHILFLEPGWSGFLYSRNPVFN